MPGQLECPMSGTNIDADLLYYSRGEDNSSYRPVLTGDVYENLLERPVATQPCLLVTHSILITIP